MKAQTVRKPVLLQVINDHWPNYLSIFYKPLKNIPTRAERNALGVLEGSGTDEGRGRGRSGEEGRGKEGGRGKGKWRRGCEDDGGEWESELLKAT